MKPNVFTVTSIQQLEPHLEAVRRDGFIPTLAIVFSAVQHRPADFSAVFARYGIEVFGAVSSGEFTHAGISEGTITGMLLDIGRDAFRVNLFDADEGFIAHIGRKVADWARECYENSALLVMCAGLQANAEELVHSFVDRTERQVPLFGGIAGIETGRNESFVFNAARVVGKGVIALAFDTRAVAVSGLAVSGWKGVGTHKIITKSQGNIVFRIDDEPVLQMYNKYLNIGDDPTLAYEYPLLLIRDDGSYILRGSISINEDQSITYGGPVPEGAKVRFSVPPGLEIIDHAVSKVSELNRQAPDADALVLFSCKGRQFTLGPMVGDEIEAIQKLWNVPLVGFFTNGEIGPMPDGRCELHNHTLVPVVIKQR